MGLFKKRVKPGLDASDPGEVDDVGGVIRENIDGSPSVRFYCGDWPADPAVVAAGHEPNGYFWEGVLRFLDPTLANSIELDSEAGMFAAYGSPAQCDRVRDLLSGLLSDADGISQLVARAEAAGHEFGD